MWGCISWGGAVMQHVMQPVMRHGYDIVVTTWSSNWNELFLQPTKYFSQPKLATPRNIKLDPARMPTMPRSLMRTRKMFSWFNCSPQRRPHCVSSPHDLWEVDEDWDQNLRTLCELGSKNICVYRNIYYLPSSNSENYVALAICVRCVLLV